MKINKNLKIFQDNPILFYSIFYDDEKEFLKKLYLFSSLINIPNIKGETLLHYSVYYGRIEKYYMLMNFGAEIRNTLEKNSLLHYASFSGKDDFLCLELIHLGLNPLEKNSLEETPIHLSANQKLSHYFNMWIQRKNIHISEILDIDQNNVLHSSKSYNHLESFHYWLKEYPFLLDKKNFFLITPQQIKKKYLKFCQFN
jgi:ankyrin repeat protein